MSLIALGVTGSIGAYKAVEIARGLQMRGHEVVAVMTRSARRFIGPLTFEAITGRRVITDQFSRGANADIEHIALASDIELLVVAPATANVIGKFAHGIADDFLSSLYLATRAPVLVAPAMNPNMLSHEAVCHNIATLRARGVGFVEPGEGFLACGWIGRGRLTEPDEVVAAADALVRPRGALVGRSVVVTAGPTYEDLDPVRYVGNRSSGRMGLALAEEAVARGARVVLVTGPTALAPPDAAEVVRVRSASEMRAAVLAHVADADALIMAAAVADYTVEGGATGAETAARWRQPDRDVDPDTGYLVGGRTRSAGPIFAGAGRGLPPRRGMSSRAGAPSCARRKSTLLWRTTCREATPASTSRATLRRSSARTGKSRSLFRPSDSSPP